MASDMHKNMAYMTPLMRGGCDKFKSTTTAENILSRSSVKNVYKFPKLLLRKQCSEKDLYFKNVDIRLA